MTELPAALQARVPTLTEVVDLPDLADPPYPPHTPPAPAVSSGGQGPGTSWQSQSQPPAFLRQMPAQSLPEDVAFAQLLEAVLADIAPPLQALVSSRLRDVLAPAVQEAVEEALEQLRQPLIDAVQAQVREQLEQSLRLHLQPPLTPAAGEIAPARTPSAPPYLRFP